MARRTRQFLSSASSTMAGKSACESNSIPITSSQQEPLLLSRTGIDEFELTDNVQTDLRIVVFEHLEEHWEEMLDSCIFAKDGGEATEVFAECGSDLRIGITNKFFDRTEDIA